jgi:hypothetical protein
MRAEFERNNNSSSTLLLLFSPNADVLLPWKIFIAIEMLQLGYSRNGVLVGVVRCTEA